MKPASLVPGNYDSTKISAPITCAITSFMTATIVWKRQDEKKMNAQANANIKEVLTFLQW